MFAYFDCAAVIAILEARLQGAKEALAELEERYEQETDPERKAKLAQAIAAGYVKIAKWEGRLEVLKAHCENEPIPVPGPDPR